LAEPERGAETVPEAAGDASRGARGRTGPGAFGWLLLFVAIAGVVLLVIADVSQISYRTVGGSACDEISNVTDRAKYCSTSAHESHGIGLLLLVALSLPMAWAAIIGRSRAAAAALAAIGVGALVIALAVDQPKLDDTRGLEVSYDAKGHTGSAFKVELAGGVLLILAGGLALVRPRPAPPPPRRRRYRDAEAAAAG
jgi:hypothetical protein